METPPKTSEVICSFDNKILPVITDIEAAELNTIATVLFAFLFKM